MNDALTIANASQRNVMLERPARACKGALPEGIHPKCFRSPTRSSSTSRKSSPVPTAGQILGDMGADVIKVEPLHGEHFRPHFGGAWVPSMNRNKRGLALDLRTEGGRDVLMRLAAQGRRLHGGLHPGRDRQAGLRLGDALEGEPAADLCLGVGLRPDRPLLQPRRLRSLHPGRDRPDGCDRSRRRRDVPRRHRGDRLLDRLVLRRRHRLRPAGAAQDRPRPAARPVAVRCRHAPDEPLDHQPRPDRRGSHPHGHLELDHLPVARVPDQDPADLHRRHQRRLLEDFLHRARQAGLARRHALRHQRRSRRQPRHPGADDRGIFPRAHLRRASGQADPRRHGLLGRLPDQRGHGEPACQGARQRAGDRLSRRRPGEIGQQSHQAVRRAGRDAAASRRQWASTRSRSCAKWATATPRSPTSRAPKPSPVGNDGAHPPGPVPQRAAAPRRLAGIDRAAGRRNRRFLAYRHHGR